MLVFQWSVSPWRKKLSHSMRERASGSEKKGSGTLSYVKKFFGGEISVREI